MVLSSVRFSTRLFKDEESDRVLPLWQQRVIQKEEFSSLVGAHDIGARMLGVSLGSLEVRSHDRLGDLNRIGRV